MKIKSNLIKVWEGMGIASIILLLCLPNGKTIMNTILEALKVKSVSYIGLSIPDFVAMGLFLIVYISSIRFFAKERSTKIFSILASVIMIITLISRVIFI